MGDITGGCQGHRSRRHALSRAIATLADDVSPHLFGFAGAAAHESPERGGGPAAVHNLARCGFARGHGPTEAMSAEHGAAVHVTSAAASNSICPRARDLVAFRRLSSVPHWRQGPDVLLYSSASPWLWIDRAWDVCCAGSLVWFMNTW